MNPKTNKILLVSLLLNILIASITVATLLNRNDPKLKEAIADGNSISLLGQEKNVEGLKTLADKLEKKWSKEDVNNYMTVMSSISKNLTKNKEYELADKYAKLTLDKLYNLPKGKKVPIEREFSFLWDINNNIFLPFKHINNLAKGRDWPEERLEAAKYYFRVWERLEKDIDPNWDPNDRTKSVEYPKPPASYTGFFASGMSPDNIKDPKLRAEYEAAVRNFQESANYRSEQYRLRRIKQGPSDLQSLQNNILKLYSGPAFDENSLEADALKQDLEKCIKDEKIRTTIIEQMKKRLEENAVPPKNIHIIPEERIVRVRELP